MIHGIVAGGAKPDPQNWVAVGTEYSLPAFSWPAMTALSKNRVAVSRNGTIQAYDFNGSSWTPVGNAITPATIGNGHGMCALDANTVITLQASSGYTFRRLSFDGSDWTDLGTWNYSLTSVANPALIRLNDTTLIAVDQGTDRVRAFVWNGSTFAYANFFAIATTGPHLCRLSDSTLALAENDNNTLRVLSWDGSAFAQVGNALSVNAFGAPIRLAPLSETRLMVHTNSNKNIGAYEFDGTDFNLVGNLSVVTGETMGTTDCDTIDIKTNTVAFIDNSSDKLRVQRFV